jgi:uncharacterized protein YprB with RNaseH-like and TPR domain
MTLEEKLRQLKLAPKKRHEDESLERQLEFLRRMDQASKPLLNRRAAKSVEECVEGRVERRESGEYFLTEQFLPLGRPYGNLRVGDIATSDLRPLNLFVSVGHVASRHTPSMKSRPRPRGGEGGAQAPGEGVPPLELFKAGKFLPDPERLVFLDTETTGLAGGTGTCAFLIGLGTVEGTGFAVRQFFLRDYVEEKAALEALAAALAGCEGLVTFNGKAFDVPLLETRYTLSRLPSPFSRLLHLDMLHPARKLWKLRLESCKLTHLERHVLGIEREGDVPGSDIPGIYFDYLRTGDARGLQPVFYHNALDIITLAALAVEMADFIRGVAEAAGGREQVGRAPARSGKRVASADNGERSLIALGSVAPLDLLESPEPLNTNGSAAQLIGDLAPALLPRRENRKVVAEGLDLFSLSRVFAGAGARDLSISAGERALASGLPEAAQPGVLWHLAVQRKRRGEFELAVEIWLRLAEPGAPYALPALRELAIYYEHRERDLEAALKFTEAALALLRETCQPNQNRPRPLGGEGGVRVPGEGVGPNPFDEGNNSPEFDSRNPAIEDFNHRRERLSRRLRVTLASPALKSRVAR